MHTGQRVGEAGDEGKGDTGMVRLLAKAGPCVFAVEQGTVRSNDTGSPAHFQNTQAAKSISLPVLKVRVIIRTGKLAGRDKL